MNTLPKYVAQIYGWSRADQTLWEITLAEGCFLSDELAVSSLVPLVLLSLPEFDEKYTRQEMTFDVCKIIEEVKEPQLIAQVRLPSARGFVRMRKIR